MTHLLVVLLAVAGCTSAAGAPPESGLTADLLVPKVNHVEYEQHARWASGAPDDFAYSERWTLIPGPATGPRRYRVDNIERHGAKEALVVATVIRVSKDGYFFEANLPLDVPASATDLSLTGAIAYDPMKVALPPTIAEAETWSVVHSADGRKESVSLHIGSPFCPRGVVTTRRWPTTHRSEEIQVDHFCAGEGWRGQEIFEYEKDKLISFWWTANVVRDGKRYVDPPMTSRVATALPGWAR